MSWWFYGKDKTGKGYVWTIDFDPFFLLIPLGVLMAILVPNLIHNPVGVAKAGAVSVALGFVCLLMAKVSLFRRGIWTSWGPGLMSVWWARLYKLGFILIGVGVVLVLLARAVTS